MPLSKELLAALPADPEAMLDVALEIEREAIARRDSGIFDAEPEMRRICLELEALSTRHPHGPKFNFEKINPAQKLSDAAGLLARAIHDIGVCRERLQAPKQDIAA
jgi:hypothetical protein